MKREAALANGIELDSQLFEDEQLLDLSRQMAVWAGLQSCGGTRKDANSLPYSERFRERWSFLDEPK